MKITAAVSRPGLPEPRLETLELEAPRFGSGEVRERSVKVSMSRGPALPVTRHASCGLVR